MSLDTSIVWPRARSTLCVVKSTPCTSSLSISCLGIPFCNLKALSYTKTSLPLPRNCNQVLRSQCSSAGNSESNDVGDDKPSVESKEKLQRRGSSKKKVVSQNEVEGDGHTFPATKPKQPRRGRRSEAAAVEEFVRDSLDRTFASMREQNPDICIEKEQLFKDRMSKDNYSDISDDEDGGEMDAEGSGQMVVEEESTTWPVDADVGWGIRASEYFEKHAIKNVIGDDGTEIDWEGEIDDNWVQEINCLEWESFAFHPSPLIVLVFERFRRPSHNWKLLKELEKALLVYWQSNDRLPPRAVKLDINIERDLAYALQVRDGPEILFLRGHKILYREKEFRSSDDLVRMIAFFYYNAKKPSWIDEGLL